MIDQLRRHLPIIRRHPTVFFRTKLDLCKPIRLNILILLASPRGFEFLLPP
jgi:hypothetical protein